MCLSLSHASSSVIQDMKTSTSLSTAQTERVFSRQPEPRLLFSALLRLDCLLLFLRPLSALRAHSPRRASPSSSNQFLFIRHRDAAPNGRSQNIKCLTSSSFVWPVGSPRTHTRGAEAHKKHTHTHACLCCVTASQGRSQQTNKGFLLALTSHFHAEKSEEAPTQQPASESQAQEC